VHAQPQPACLRVCAHVVVYGWSRAVCMRAAHVSAAASDPSHGVQALGSKVGQPALPSVLCARGVASVQLYLESEGVARCAVI